MLHHHHPHPFSLTQQVQTRSAEFSVNDRSCAVPQEVTPMEAEPFCPRSPGRVSSLTRSPRLFGHGIPSISPTISLPLHATSPKGTSLSVHSGPSSPHEHSSLGKLEGGLQAPSYSLGSPLSRSSLMRDSSAQKLARVNSNLQPSRQISALQANSSLLQVGQESPKMSRASPMNRGEESTASTRSLASALKPTEGSSEATE